MTYNQLANMGAGFSKMERNRIYKIGNGIMDGTINKDNYWDMIRKMVKGVTTDRTMNSWERIADMMYNRVYEK